MLHGFAWRFIYEQPCGQFWCSSLAEPFELICSILLYQVYLSNLLHAKVWMLGSICLWCCFPVYAPMSSHELHPTSKLNGAFGVSLIILYDLLCFISLFVCICSMSLKKLHEVCQNNDTRYLERPPQNELYGRDSFWGWSTSHQLGSRMRYVWSFILRGHGYGC